MSSGNQKGNQNSVSTPYFYSYQQLTDIEKRLQKYMSLIQLATACYTLQHLSIIAYLVSYYCKPCQTIAKLVIQDGHQLVIKVSNIKLKQSGIKTDSQIKQVIKEHDSGDDVYAIQGYNGLHVPHGFRASARTMIVEQLNGFSESLVELQLGHNVRDANGRAYNRVSMLSYRVELMQAWADYLDQLRRA